jgi:two-component system sensor histidine kinase KdpD
MSISSRIERVRVEDLLEEEEPTRRAIRGGVGRRRQLAGLAVGVVGLPLLTLLLDSSSASLESVVLLYLLAVVMLAAIGGVLIAVAGAVAATLLINYFFVDPVHTLDIEHGHQALALAVFLVVAIIVSGALDLATRRARTARQAVAQAETLSALAGGDLDEPSSLKDVIHRARDTFQMESVALLERDRPDEPWVEVERSGWARPGEEAPLQFDLPISPRLRLIGRGPALFAEDQRVLSAFAAAAETAYEGRRLSAGARAAQALAETGRQRTALLAAAATELHDPLERLAAAVGGLRDSAPAAVVDAIDDATRHLERVAADLLDASRIQAGALAVDAHPVALAAAVDAALAGIPAAAQRVHVDVPAELPRVQADPALLERLMAGLVDRAARRGRAEIGATAGATSIRIEITGHGMVAAPDHDSLGMAVAHGLAEAMSGALVSESSADALTLRLRLPRASGPT